MKFRPLLVALAMSMTTTAVAQRAAPPADAAISARHLARLRAVFREAYEPEVLLSSIAYSSGYPEHLVGLRRSGNGYEVFSVRVSPAVWDYGKIEMFRSRIWAIGTLRRGGGFDDHSDEEAARIASTLPPNPVNLQRSTCAVQADPELADSIRTAWQNRFLEVPIREPSGVARIFEAYIVRTGNDEREVFYDEWASDDRAHRRLIELANSMEGFCRLGGVQGSGILEALGIQPNG